MNILLQWAKLTDPNIDYVNLVNDIIPNDTVRIKKTTKDSKRVHDRIRNECIRIEKKIKEANRIGSKKKRNVILDSFTKVTILASDIMTPGEMELDIRRLEEKVKELQDRLDSLNVEVEQWRGQYTNLEEEKKSCLQK